jgi:hypothetical protein
MENMLLINSRQLKIFDYHLKNDYLIYISKRITSGFPEFIDKYKEKLLPALKRLLNQCKKWDLKEENHIVKYIFLLLSYENVIENELDKNIQKLMTWPGRNPEDKLEYLQNYLINKHYDSNSV